MGLVSRSLCLLCNRAGTRADQYESYDLNVTVADHFYSAPVRMNRVTV